MCHLTLIYTSERVIRKLADFMLDTKAPNSTSTLINGVTIVIDLIRHNNRYVYMRKIPLGWEGKQLTDARVLV